MVTKLMARNVTKSGRITKARLKQLEALRKAPVPEDLPPEHGDTLTVYEVWIPTTGRIIGRHLSRGSAYRFANSFNSCNFDGTDPEAVVRELVFTLATPQAELPDTFVEILLDGKVQRLERFTDPRVEFCRFFNEQQERIATQSKGRIPARVAKPVAGKVVHS